MSNALSRLLTGVSRYSVISRARIGSKSHNRFAFLAFIPAVVTLFFLAIVPLGYTFYLSLFELNILQIEGTWIGFANYATLLSDPEFLLSLWTGAVFASASVAIQLVFGLVFALALNKSFRGGSVARTLAIFPYLVPTITVALIWQWMLSPVIGLVNSWGTALGLLAESISFYGDADLAMGALVLANSWKFTSFVVLILLARLQAIDTHMYQQAKICGASQYQMFRDITLPHLRSAILLIILLRFIWMFNKFDIIWLLTRGGPRGATTTMPVYIYKETFFNYSLGAGSAASVILFLILLVFSVLYFWWFKPSEEVATR